ncbi:glycosyltransferase family 2 protein [Maricaulis sp.]|uniref:glycosyltransferase family 2 protein n=1 Tax=Maricaulis sp. TaxID=1486257 RepID=UPI001B217202|nr:glycosyltransferase family 2 protein [Maricaulis sp.]MBO6764617.1 glycosyltransferase family 2 protein [Maricaulis sp.]
MSVHQPVPQISAPHVGATPDDADLPEIAVIVPVYKGAAMLGELVRRLRETLRGINARYQIVLVDDRSPDDSWTGILAESAADPGVLGVRLSRNFGQHAAISAGMAHARARWYVVMDCDLQDPPEAIADLYRHAIETGADVVIAERETSGLGAGRNLGSTLFNTALRWSSGLEVSSKFGNFRIFSDKVAAAFRAYPEQLRLFPAIMTQLGFETRRLRLPRNERAEGKSSYNLFKLAKLGLETIIAYSEKPLWLMTGVGVAVCIASVLFGLTITVNALVNGISVPGYASLASLISFLGGLQVFLISLVGLYVGRALAEAKRRPVFIVDTLAAADAPGTPPRPKDTP